MHIKHFRKSKSKSLFFISSAKIYYEYQSWTMIYYCLGSYFLIHFQRELKGKGGRERNINVRRKYQLAAPNIPPRVNGACNLGMWPVRGLNQLFSAWNDAQPQGQGWDLNYKIFPSSIYLSLKWMETINGWEFIQNKKRFISSERFVSKLKRTH